MFTYYRENFKYSRKALYYLLRLPRLVFSAAFLTMLVIVFSGWWIIGELPKSTFLLSLTLTSGVLFLSLLLLPFLVPFVYITPQSLLQWVKDCWAIVRSIAEKVVVFRKILLITLLVFILLFIIVCFIVYFRTRYPLF
jgi:hypothetical protein